MSELHMQLQPAETRSLNASMSQTFIKGLDGKDGVGIDRVDSSMSADSAFVNVVIYLTNGTSKLVQIPCGKKGEDGKDYVLTDADKQLIASIVKGMITIPTKVSQLKNDSNFLTEHQDISGKQDVITDLATIREGASRGATALQSLPTDVVRDADYVHTDNNFTATLLAKLNALQNYDDADVRELISKVQNALNTLTGIGDTTDVIDTFNEVISFLNTFKNNDSLASVLSSLKSDIEGWVEGKNYLTSIPKASKDVLGCIKIDPNLGTEVGSSGNIRSKVYDFSNFDSLNDLCFISKGTLRNLLNAMNYLTEHQSLADYAKRGDIPTSLSQLNNDKGFAPQTHYIISEDMFDIEFDDTKGVAPYSTSYGYSNITIHEDAGVEWKEGAMYTFVLNTKVIASSNYRNGRMRIGNGEWKPLFGATTILTASSHFVKGVNFICFFKSTCQENGALHMFYDSNTTYTMNYQVEAGKHRAGEGAYAVSRYSLCLQKPNLTWEKVTLTTATYSTATSKKVNPHGFLLNRIRYYNTTTNYANGELIATNTLATQAASVDMRYSTNCGGTPAWNEGDKLFLAGTIGDDGLFYLDATQWWTNQLPTENDGKLYIFIGIVLTANSYNASFLMERPILYHDGNGIREYRN